MEISDNDGIEVEHSNFVGHYKSLLTKEECETIIKIYDHLSTVHREMITNRRVQNDGDDHKMKDESLSFDSIMWASEKKWDTFTNTNYDEMNIGVTNFENMLELFHGENKILDKLFGAFYEWVMRYKASGGESWASLHWKFQRTNPMDGSGYHVWHHENGNRVLLNRFGTWIMYLNDVEVGGETELLYYGERFKPVQGDMIVFPAGFTHTHRGNPPISGEKNILTGWLEMS